MHRCLDCKKNLCPLCSSCHDNSHTIIEYDLVNYICQEDNDNFTGYCEKCKKHFCMSCEEDHDGHKIIEFKNNS